MHCNKPQLVTFGPCRPPLSEYDSYKDFGRDVEVNRDRMENKGGNILAVTLCQKQTDVRLHLKRQRLS